MRTIATKSGGRRTHWIKLKSLLLMLRIPSMWVFHSSPWKKILHKDIAIQNVSTPLDVWKTEGKKVVFGILSYVQQDPLASENGDAENEDFIIALSLFLLDIYQRFPDEQEAIIDSDMGECTSHLENI
jgi:hypothetical protein